MLPSLRPPWPASRRVWGSNVVLLAALVAVLALGLTVCSAQPDTEPDEPAEERLFSWKPGHEKYGARAVRMHHLCVPFV